MKIAIVYNNAPTGSPDAEDVLNEVRLVSESMSKEGHEIVLFPLTGKAGHRNEAIHNLSVSLRTNSYDLLFNLFDGFERDPLSQHYVSLLLRTAKCPVTGSEQEAMLSTTDKTLSKKVMEAHHIPTPQYLEYLGGSVQDLKVSFPVILKPAYEDASVGIDDASVIRNRETLLSVLPAYFEKFNRQPVVIEEFVEGREFHVSLLEKSPNEVEVFPIAETIFDKWEEGKPKIVGYKAKWDADSHEYQNTLRKFNPPDAPLDELKAIALDCWRVFRLRGYVRVDFRTDSQGRVFVIEVNANPCLSPDAGFLAAAKEAGYEPNDVVRFIADAALGIERVRRQGAGGREEGQSVKTKFHEPQGERQPAAGSRNEPWEGLKRLRFRQEITPNDRAVIGEIVESTGNFTEDELAVALELVDDRLQKREQSEYRFLIADLDGTPIGYVCFGRITVTESSYDVFWIATRKDLQGKGIGQELLLKTEQIIFGEGGTNVILETSSTPKYVLTRKFYQKLNYREVARVPDFYAENDDKIIFVKSR